jgi:putative transcriptional regulator
MSKAGSRILQGAREALAYARGEANVDDFRVHIPADVDVKGIRAKLGMSQDEFAQRYGLTAARVRDWEQGRSKPDSAARAYLIVIDKVPDAVELALSPPQHVKLRGGIFRHHEPKQPASVHVTDIAPRTPRRTSSAAAKSKGKRA